MIYDALIAPFADYGFMRRALVASIALAVGGAPLGVLMVLRRMTLIGDAMTHAILPGAAIAFLVAGVSLWPMTIGGLIAGLLIALAAGTITRLTQLKEDASFMGTYLISLSAGVLIISISGGAVDVMHVLFGNILAVANDSLVLMTSIASISLLTLAAIYRPLLIECFDPTFLASQKGRGAMYHFLFLMLIVLNLVSAFQALGTLMALGLMVLPAIAARFWARSMEATMLLSVLIAIVSAYGGLLISYHFNLPSGPAIILIAGGAYVVSLIAGVHGSIMSRWFPRRHYAV
jgi:zinc/manganese transport system permease protein